MEKIDTQAAIPLPGEESRGRARRYAWGLITATAGLLCLAAVSIGVSLYLTAYTSGVSRWMNEAGRKRVQVFRLAYLAGHLPSRDVSRNREFEFVMSEMESRLAGLSRGDSFFGAPHIHTEAMRSEIDGLIAEWRKLAPFLKLAAASKVKPTGQRERLSSFVNHVDAVLKTHEDWLTRRSGRAKRLQTGAMSIVVAVMFLLLALSAKLVRMAQAAALERSQSDRLRHLNSILLAIRNVNQHIVRERDPRRLIEAACQQLTAARGYKTAWIALFDESGGLETFAQSGLDPRGAALEEHLRAGECPFCGKALLQAGEDFLIAKPAVGRAGCPLSAQAAGYAGLSVRLEFQGKAYGILSVSALYGPAFPEDDKELLKEIGEDIAFALHSHRLEAAREAAESRWRKTFDSTSDGICVLDKEGTILQCNAAANLILGGSQVPLAGLSCSQVLCAAPEAGKDCPFEEARRTLKRSRRLLRLGENWVQATIEPSLDSAGKLAGAVCALSDVTGLINSQEELRRSREKLAHSEKLKAVGQLAGGIAHDFNNLLQAIMGYGKFLADAIPAGSPMRDDTEEMLNAARRAADLTRHLLAFSRQQPLHPKAIDLNEVAGGLSKLLKRVIPESVQIQIVPAAGLWHALADPGQMEQVLLNLAVNARDAMPEGGRLTIRLENKILDGTAVRADSNVPPGEYVALSVEDTGTGISPDVLPRIFEPFFTTKDQGKGTGLGLASVFGIIRQSGGYIEVKSEMGKGTVFSVYLPRTMKSPGAEAAVVERPPVRGGGTVLLVEDDGQLLKLASRALRGSGFTVAEAGDGLRALRMIEAKEVRPDILVTDIVMPNMGGLELARRLRVMYPGLSALFFSGYIQDPQTLTKAEEMGIEIMSKPFTTGELLAKISELLNLGRRRS